MNILPLFQRNKCSDAAREWNWPLDFESTRAKYIADGSLDKSCSVLQLELRTILDFPMAIHYLTTYNSDGSELFVQWATAWNDCEECMKHANQKEELDGLFLRHKNSSGWGLFDEVEKAYLSRIYSLTDDDGLELIVEKTLQASRRWCFTQLFTLVYEPFRLTSKFALLHKLLCDPDRWVTPNSFEYFDVIAKGSFGLVMLCSKKSTGAMYAMKILTKRHLLRHFHRDKRRVLTEMLACSLCDHPYISKLSYSIQTASLAMLVLPVAVCGDLSRSLAHTPTGCFTFDRAQFYAAEIVSALLYLHKFGFIYRDLKPENVLLNADGHVMLTDFGSLADMDGLLGHLQYSFYSDYFSNSTDASSQGVEGASDISTGCGVVPKPHSLDVTAHMSYLEMQQICGKVSTQRLQRTKTMVGTIEFMAPEMIAMIGNKSVHEDGYTVAVDWWSLGVLLYRLLVGSVPFKRLPFEVLEVYLPDLLIAHADKSFEDVYTTMFGSVDYNFPQLTPPAVDLLKRLLTFDPDQRLCGGMCGQAVYASTPDKCPVRSHSFFSGIDWAALEKKEVTPPYIPVNEVISSVGAAASMTGHGLAFTQALACSEHSHLIDDTMFSLRSNTGTAVDNIVKTLSALVSSKTNQSTSHLRTISDSSSKLKVLDADQKYFHGWNYVSCELFEGTKPSTTNSRSPHLASLLVSGFRRLIGSTGANSRVAPL